MKDPENESPTAPAHETPESGLPTAPPDVEEELADEIDNVVPTFSYDVLPLVALGGSAGSIGAFQAFFREMPVDSGMAFVVILHLSPDHESTLATLLQRETSMPVVQAEDRLEVAPNSVYVIPPGKHLTVSDGHLALADLHPHHGRRVAVDLFFRSLADTHGAHASAIVLSGADGDGALGVKRIKERGGLTIAQDTDEAEQPSMPRTAIATGMVDWILPVREMPHRLLAYQQTAREIQLPPEEGPHPARAPETAAEVGEQDLRAVLTFLHERTGHDFTYYKRASIVRRIARRMQVNRTIDLEKYLTFLQAHPGEAGALQQELLIPVTNFFRDRDAFSAMEMRIPSLFTGKKAGDTLRVWVAACASGEEAYSIAILLLEYAGTLPSPPAIQIFATDLDDASIQTARSAHYPDSITTDVSKDRLHRFFIKEDNGYQVRREVRHCVLFAVHDLLKDAPFSRVDFLSCRNLLIYLDPTAQSRARKIFHFALRPHGLLFLGPSEPIADGQSPFEIVDKKHRLYLSQVVRPEERRSMGFPLPQPSGTLARLSASAPNYRNLPTTSGMHGSETVSGSWSELHFKLIEHFGPPSIVVNQDNRIQHVSENAGRFLQFSGGEPSANLLRSIHPMLRLDLRSALYRSNETGKEATVEGVAVEIGGEKLRVDLRVVPAQELAPGFFLLILQASPAAPEDLEIKKAALEPAWQYLERELENSKGKLREAVTEYEAALEELKASNEELQAMNEELRSTTEELETGREELQSINEELTTVNFDLKSKVDELASANSDLDNLMEATDIALLFLDRNLQIMRYTPAAEPLFNLIAGDLGRPLSHLRHALDYPELEADARRVFAHLRPVQREVSSSDGHFYLARLLPYRSEDRISGVVLTLVNLTEQKLAAEELRASEERYRTLFNSIDEGFCVIEVIEDATGAATDFRFLEVNPAFEKQTGLSAVVGRTMLELVPDHERRWVEIYHRVLRTGQAERFEEYASKMGRWFDAYAFRLEVGEAQRVAVVFSDVTRRRETQEALTASEERLRLIIENAREYAIVSLAMDRTITSWNTGAERIIGYAEAEAVGKTADIFFTEEDRAAEIPAREAATAMAEGRALDERWHMRKDGSRFWASGVMMAMRNAEGNVIGLIKIFRDQTNERASREALESTQNDLYTALREMDEARQAKDHFLAVLSHELRTPLMPVLMAVELLRHRKDLDASVLETLEMIGRNVRLESGFIDDLLDLTRMEKGKVDLVVEGLDFHDCVRHAVAISQGDIEQKRQELTVSLDAQETSLSGNDSRLQQVVWNLLKNASKFTPVDGRIALRTRNEPGKIVLEITDSGVGFAAGAAERIFEAFVQADASVTKEFGGLGLGLAISKATVLTHHGEIHAASEGLGKGATFTVSLPLQAS